MRAKLSAYAKMPLFLHVRYILCLFLPEFNSFSENNVVLVANQDHTDCDCVMVAVLSHGMGTSYILAHDYPYPADMLWAPFIPDRCPTLAGKPKLFLVQVCLFSLYFYLELVYLPSCALKINVL